MSNTDFFRLLKTPEILKVLTPPKKWVHSGVRHFSPFSNNRQLIKLNPFAGVTKRQALLQRIKRRYEFAIEQAKKQGKEQPKNHPAIIWKKNQENRAKQLKAAKANKKPKQPKQPKQAKKPKEQKKAVKK